MKQPLTALLIAPDEGMRYDIETGQKTITIREGHRDYRAGQAVMLSCHLVPWAVQADITDVKHCVLREVTEDEWRDDGFVSQDDLLTQMHRFYPALTLDSAVTVIRWTNARGALVERHDA
ncbi:MAG TPA: ASCH domain-containing protein [Candidatus Baltobacteraceae bacterium]|nr:ASCH domain-containing protein [Candidatus Baltobacteraceae bacterium]